MNQRMKDQIAKVVFKTVSNAIARGPIDAIDLSERVLDGVELVYDMHTEEAGIASIPEALRADNSAFAPHPAWDHRENSPGEPEDNRPHFLAPPPTKQSVTPVAQAKPASVIVLPGDPGFSTNPSATQKDDTARPGLVRASLKKTVRRPASNAPQKQYWDEAELMQTILANTPEKIVFEITRADGAPFKVSAERNVQNKQGLGSVVLTYKDPRFGEGGNVVMQSNVPFSLYDESVDFDAALESTAKQLSGLYQDRSGGNPEPTAFGPPPNLGAYMQNGMPGGNVRIDIDRDDMGRAIVIDSPLHADRGADRVLQSILSTVKRGNSGLVPPESPLKTR